MKIRLIAWFLIVCMLSGFHIGVLASPTGTAEDISDSTTFEGTGYQSLNFLFDGDSLSCRASDGNASISLRNSNGIGYLYFIFDHEYPGYVIEDTSSGQQAVIDNCGFLHSCIDLSQYFDQLPTAVTVYFESGSVVLNELTVYSPGQLPDEVQQWKPPAEGRTDILLLSTHGDDEQLFFAGLLPLYAGERNATVQVAYLTDHRNLTSERVHEMLNGLWAVGCDIYPIFGEFADFRVDDMQKTYQEYQRLGVSKEDLLEFVVAQLRRFRPQVVVGHDIQGEYGHGMHMVYTDCLIQSLELSNHASSFPALAEQYGTWEVPKTYLHLYEENPIVIDYDQPLPHFDGMTAFEVTQKLGYPCHKSQQGTWFTRWINGKDGKITSASQIRTYNPCQFGLYHSTVGSDEYKNDFLENIITYAEQEQIRLEQERLEQERLEQERLEQERLEQERLEQERLEQAQVAQQKQATQRRIVVAITLLLLLVTAVIAVTLLYLHRRIRV